VIGTGSERGFLCTSNGVLRIPDQEGHFRSAFPGYPNRVPTSTLPARPHYAFTVTGFFSKTNVNANVNLVTTLTGLLGSACGPNYLNQFNISEEKKQQVTPYCSARKTPVLIEVHPGSFIPFRAVLTPYPATGKRQ
jgi:hypothetical protein